jgi:hypothetical protein
VARNVILTGGHTHSFPVAAPALAALLREIGIESSIDDDIDRGLATIERDEPHLVTVYALRWTMREGDKYAPYRDRWAFHLAHDGQQALCRHLSRRGGLLALHTALICFDDWPAWEQILGGRWAWGRSNHPPYGAVDVRPGEDDHAIVRGLPPFTLNDEAYGDLSLAPETRPLMHARTSATDWRPALWAHVRWGGRVVVDTLGHDAGAFGHPVHRRIVKRAAAWALGRDEAEVASI